MGLVSISEGYREVFSGIAQMAEREGFEPSIFLYFSYGYGS